MSPLDASLAWFLGLSVLVLLAAAGAIVGLALLAVWVRARADRRTLRLREGRAYIFPPRGTR